MITKEARKNISEHIGKIIENARWIDKRAISPEHTGFYSDYEWQGVLDDFVLEGKLSRVGEWDFEVLTPKSDIFYMVYVDGSTGSTIKYSTAASAIQEAERLARLPENFNRKVFLLRMCNYCHVYTYTPVEWVGILH